MSNFGERLRIRPGTCGDAQVLTVLGEVDLSTVGALRAALAQGIETAGAAVLILDLRRVRWFTAHGLTALVEARGRARSRGRALRVVVGENPAVAVPLRATGLDRTITAFDSLHAALADAAAASAS